MKFPIPIFILQVKSSKDIPFLVQDMSDIVYSAEGVNFQSPKTCTKPALFLPLSIFIATSYSKSPLSNLADFRFLYQLWQILTTISDSSFCYEIHPFGKSWQMFEPLIQVISCCVTLLCWRSIKSNESVKSLWDVK